ncbi:MAG: histidine triad nucleotide-binding protein [Capsulimonadaceae bacterium]|nr:histidine triad nucleotide-binding protein [Capsulimonadaceae bacterium]
MSDCIFCKIARHEIPARVLFENDDLFAFHDINPQAPVHIVIIPKVHVENVLSASDEHTGILGKLLRAAAGAATQTGIAETGFRVVLNNGVDGGQSVDHLHVHVLGGRKLAWPPG